MSRQKFGDGPLKPSIHRFPPSKCIVDEQKKSAKDVGIRRWFVCFAAFLTYGGICGTCKSYGVLFAYFTDNFQEQQLSRFHLSLPGSLCIGITWLFSPLASLLTAKYGTRPVAFFGMILAGVGAFTTSYAFTESGFSIIHVCLTYGMLVGLGFSLALTPSLAILGHYFDRQLGAANGIATSGCSTFIFLYPLSVAPFLEIYGLDLTLKFLSSAIVLLSMCSLLFKERIKVHSSRLEQSDQCKDAALPKSTSLVSNVPFVSWAAAVVLAHIGYFVPFIHLPKMMESKVDNENTNLLLTCIGGASIVGRLSFGIVSDLPWVNRVVLHGISCLVMGAVMILYTIADTYYIAVLLSFAFGLFDGCFFALQGPISSDLVGERDTPKAIGILFSISSIPLTIGPCFAGFLYDVFGGYTVAFLAASVPSLVGGILMFVVALQQRRRPQLCIEQHRDERAVPLKLVGYP